MNIQITANQASTATINVIPTDKIFNVRPRTKVFVFFWDEDDSVWRILWEGEVLGVGYSKSSDSRQVSLNCADFTNYWDYTRKHLLTMREGAQTYTKAKLFFGDQKTIVTFNSSNQVNNKIVEKILQGNNLPNALLEFMRTVANDLPYYKRINDKMKLYEHLTMIQDDQAEKLLETKEKSALLTRMEGSTGRHLTLREILYTFQSAIYYNHVSTCSVPYVAGNYNACVMMPNLYAALPPRCNVVFPDQSTSITFNRDFMAEPTRIMMRTTPVWENKLGGESEVAKTVYPTYITPAILGKNIRASIENREFYETRFTEEEIEKGIIPEIRELPYAEMLSMRPEGADIRQYMTGQLNYLYQLERHAGRTLSVTMEINPWLACNFPCVVLDSSKCYVATIANISHTINSSGGAYTSIQCNMARELRPDLDFDDTPVMPTWFNESYLPVNVDNTYQQLLGCKAIGEESSREAKKVSSITDESVAYRVGYIENGTYINISKIVATLYHNPKSDSEEAGLYQHKVGTNESYSFCNRYRRRSIATMEEVFSDIYKVNTTSGVRTGDFGQGQGVPSKVIGTIFDYTDGPQAVDSGVAGIIDGPYHKQKIVEEYAKEIAESRGLDGR